MDGHFPGSDDHYRDDPDKPPAGSFVELASSESLARSSALLVAQRHPQPCLSTRSGLMCRLPRGGWLSGFTWLWGRLKRRLCAVGGYPPCGLVAEVMPAAPLLSCAPIATIACVLAHRWFRPPTRRWAQG